MKAGDLVRAQFKLGATRWSRQGLLLGFKNSSGYIYAEIYWFYENVVGSCQPDLLEVVK